MSDDAFFEDCSEFNPLDIFFTLFFLVGSMMPAAMLFQVYFRYKLYGSLTLQNGEHVGVAPAVFQLLFMTIFFTIWNGMLLYTAPYCYAPYWSYPMGIGFAYWGAKEQYNVQKAEMENGVTEISVQPNPNVTVFSGHMPAAAPPRTPAYGYQPEFNSSYASSKPAATWTKFNDPLDNKPYWYNSETKETTWNDPDKQATAPPYYEK